MNKDIKYLIEKTANFNVIDYQEDEEGSIDNNDINNIIYKYYPKDNKELFDVICKKIEENKYGDSNMCWPDFSDIDISQIKSLCGVFMDALKLYYTKFSRFEIELIGWDTSNVISLEKLFEGCKKLKYVGLYGLDLSNVKDMSNMFKDCYSLECVNFENVKMEYVTNMDSMFNGCKNLKKLDLSNFSTRHVLSMKSMFEKCELLTELDLSSFETQDVRSMGFMFHECKNLKKLDLSNFDTHNL